MTRDKWRAIYGLLLKRCEIFLLESVFNIFGASLVTASQSFFYNSLHTKFIRVSDNLLAKWKFFFRGKFDKQLFLGRSIFWITSGFTSGWVAFKCFLFEGMALKISWWSKRYRYKNGWATLKRRMYG